MPVRVITTGGTIAQLLDEEEVRHSAGAELLAALRAGAGPGEDMTAEITVEDLFDLPSTYIGATEMMDIADRVTAAATDPAVEGIVVTHGTATMEETIYFTEIVAAAAKPVVFTGAQRFAQSLGYDGQRNLAHAITVAACPAASGLGTVLVMDGEIHAARDVAELHPSATGGFGSLAWGPVGRVESGQVTVARKVIRDAPVPGVRRPLARVDLVTTYAGMSGDVVLAVAGLGARGLVIQGMTTGAIPVGIVDAVGELVRHGVIVAVCTRCPAGGMLHRPARFGGVAGYGPDLEKLGVVCTDLSGVKARLRLMALLSADLPAQAVRDRMSARPPDDSATL